MISPYSGARPDMLPSSGARETAAKAFAALAGFPRTVLCPAPTPLEPLTNLAHELAYDSADRRLLVKRDDAQPLAFGGNKIRQLEFHFGAAIDEGSDTVLITGAVQSNYCRLAAAYAARLGLECHIQLEERVAREDPLYRRSGNVLLDRLFGATLHSYPEGEDEAGADARLEALAGELSARGRRPHVIHLGPTHPPLGALGYVVAARELAEQIGAPGVAADLVVLPSGSGATHAGMLFGLRALGLPTRVLGVCVRRSAAAQAPRVLAQCEGIARLLECPNPVRPADVELTDAFLAPGYGQAGPEVLKAIQRAARREALILDPVYSGKAMAAFLDAAERLEAGTACVFVHTGGTPAIFAYAKDIEEGLVSHGEGPPQSC